MESSPSAADDLSLGTQRGGTCQRSSGCLTRSTTARESIFARFLERSVLAALHGSLVGTNSPFAATQRSRQLSEVVETCLTGAAERQ